MTTPRSLRRADTKNRLDVASWSALDSVRFMLRTVGSGEVIGGPFYFGRAFDLPPFFTFSAVAQTLGIGSGPQLTVGVAEWIVDEQGMYVGANMWFKLSHINPCLPSAFYGTQAISDPGFEGGFVRGPDNGELPIITGTPMVSGHQIVWPSTYPSVVEQVEPGSDFTADLSTEYPWVQSDLIRLGGDSNNTWRDDTSSTRDGIYSVSHDFAAVNDVFSASPRLYPMGVTSCTMAGFGWVAKPGDEITLSAWVRTSSATGGAGVGIGCHFMSEFNDLSEFTGPGSDPVLLHRFTDTAWTFLTRKVFPPVPLEPSEVTRIAQPYIVARRFTFPTTFFGTIFADKATLALVGGTSAPGFLTTTDLDFEVSLRFSGRILKGYSNIHPVRSVEAPIQVVLT